MRYPLVLVSFLWLSGCGGQLLPVVGSFCDTFLPILSGFFNGWSCQEIIDSMGTPFKNSTNANPRTPPNTIVIQDSLDWRTDGPSECVSTVRDQERCGSCWAFATSAALAQRFCIIGYQHGIRGLVLSPQQKVNCDKTCYSGTSSCNAGCNGGYLDLAWQNFVNAGVVPEVCVPYAGSDGSCPTQCNNPSAYNFTLFQATASYALRTVTDMQRDLQQYGPVSAGIQVYSDFLQFSGPGVYTYDGTSSSVGGHAVKVIGWGTQSSVPYWIIENSWGTGWGNNGYAKIKRGSNEIGIESYVISGLPKINGVEYDNDYSQNGASVISLAASLFIFLQCSVLLMS